MFLSQGIALTNKIQSNVKSGKEKACVQVHRDGKITWRNSVQRPVAFVNPMVSVRCDTDLMEPMQANYALRTCGIVGSSPGQTDIQAL